MLLVVGLIYMLSCVREVFPQLKTLFSCFHQMPSAFIPRLKGTEDFYMKTKISVYDNDTMVVSGTSYYLFVMDYYKVLLLFRLYCKQNLLKRKFDGLYMGFYSRYQCFPTSEATL